MTDTSDRDFALHQRNLAVESGDLHGAYEWQKVVDVENFKLVMGETNTQAAVSIADFKHWQEFDLKLSAWRKAHPDQTHVTLDEVWAWEVEE